MQRIRYRRAVLALLLCVLLSLPSCSWLIVERRGEGSQTGSTTTAAGGTTAQPYIPPERPDSAAAAAAALAALPERSFDGASVLVAAAGETGSLLFPEAGENDDLSGEQAARLNRNAAVCARYDVSFIPSTASLDDTFRETQNAALSGLYYADLLLLPGSQLGRFAAAGLLRNLHNLPFWHQTHDGQGGSASTVYADLGGAVLDYDRLPAVYFNRPLAESLGYDLYADVEAGRWTLELYLMAAAEASAAGTTGYASCNGRTDDAAQLLAACGLTLVDASADVPQVTLPEQTDALDTLLRRWLSGKAAALSAPADSFAGGEVLFFNDTLHRINELTDAETRWGILPLPKYTWNDQYITPAPADAPVLAVTANNTKFEMTGLLLAALNAASTDVITDAFVTDRLTYNLRDGETAVMLDRIAASVRYDFSTLYGSGYPSLAYATTTAVADAAAGAAWGGASLAAVVSARLASANYELSRAFSGK